MIHLDPHIFRAYDIRGKADSQLTEEVCELIGKAFGAVLIEKYGKEHPSPSVVVGRDARTHSPRFEAALIKGLVSAGCSVRKMGATPSPLNYFTICHQKLDAGVQITASHNPKEDNGIKLQIRDAEAFSGEDLQKLRERIEKASSFKLQASSQKCGSAEDIDAVTPYLEFLEKTFKGVGQGLKIVVDSGNGIAGPVYCEALRRVGAIVSGLYTDPDGSFPNHPADPSRHATLRDLQEKVRSEKADMGFGFDGDGDRVGLVDERGSIVTADQTLLLLARDHLQRYPGAPVIFTVSNSSLLLTEVKKWGGRPVMCKVGHSFVEHAMREEKALLGGEQSGHFFCGEEYYGFDDALVAALRILSILQALTLTQTLRRGGVRVGVGVGGGEGGGSKLSVCINQFPKVYQSPERRPHCPDDRKADVVSRVTGYFQKKYPVDTLDGARIDFGDGAWAGVRFSNTSPCLSVCIEARSQEKLKEVEGEVLSHLRTYREVELKS